MSYNEDEVLGDSEFNPKENDGLDEPSFDEPLEENDGFRFDEESEPEGI